MSSKLKVQELRDELSKRGLDTTGLKPALVRALGLMNLALYNLTCRLGSATITCSRLPIIGLYGAFLVFLRFKGPLRRPQVIM